MKTIYLHGNIVKTAHTVIEEAAVASVSTAANTAATIEEPREAVFFCGPLRGYITRSW
jgi:hypothetical protein